MRSTYAEFLNSKIKVAEAKGIDISQILISKIALPHQPALVKWALKQGRALIGAQFGLGKTFVQCEILRQLYQEHYLQFPNKKYLIVCPLGVKHQFIEEDGPKLGMTIKYCRTDAEVDTAGTQYIITNYERVRDGNINIDERFIAITLDEGDVLRSLGSKTTQKFIEDCKNVPFRFVATATPDPNDHLEILNYSDFLGIMDRGQALTRWFKRDSLKAGNLKIHPQHEDDFWTWVSSWAIFLSKPSELGFSDEGYELPGIDINWHLVPFDESQLGMNVDDRGQLMAFQDATADIKKLAKVKRATIDAKVEFAKSLIGDSQERKLLWHLMEDERRKIEKAFPESVSVYGTQTIEEKEQRILDFAHGKINTLATKPEIAGSGCNFQYSCHWAIFLSIDFRFKDFIQAVHRIYRYMQKNQVRIDILFTRLEEPIVTAIKRKWKQHTDKLAKMSELIAKFGLNHDERVRSLQRSIGVQRREVKGTGYHSVNNDSCEEIRNLESESAGLQLTSIPFGNHYEYTSLYNDFGHNDSDIEFFQQMDFLIPEKFRVLQPGRLCVVHVKDRILYGWQNGLNFPTVNPFSDKTITAYTKHGYAFMGRITIATDVVRENAQTYRLGWSENCKDGTKMGVGSPEYLLLFRKPVPGAVNGYATNPVYKEKVVYTRGRWQIDANSTWKSSGNRLLTPEEYCSLEPGKVFKNWKLETLNEPYDYERHVLLCSALDDAGRLPSSFMTMPPHTDAWNVWDDVNYMQGLNIEQNKRKQENHICPLPFDIVDRIIERFSSEGDRVDDYFGGLGTTGLRALMKGRRAFMCELNPVYFDCSARYLKEHEQKKQVPTLF